jgi:Fe-S-cluster-containing dehydrogenase component
MTAYRLIIDANRCTGCGSCETACQLEHDLPPAVRPIRALALGPFPAANGWVMSFALAVCAHCAEPICVRVCPQGAMQQRPDGIVFSDPARCVGCRTCAAACPWSAPVLNTATGKIAKCDYCRERLDAGLAPACVLKCPTGALAFGPAGRLIQQRQRQDAERIAAAMPLDARRPSLLAEPVEGAR